MSEKREVFAVQLTPEVIKRIDDRYEEVRAELKLKNQKIHKGMFVESLFSADNLNKIDPETCYKK
jgi:hypothetical protein